MKIYLSGPMTGIPELNFPYFHRVTADLRVSGEEVINPAEINSDPNADWLECIIEDIKQLATCDGIYLLNGWEKSYGAQIEYLVAKKLGLEIEYDK